jgi:hypothetical protein
LILQEKIGGATTLLCGISHQEINVSDKSSWDIDHYSPTFAELKKDFLEQENLTLDKIKVKDSRLPPELENKFREFHKERVLTDPDSHIRIVLKHVHKEENRVLQKLKSMGCNTQANCY